jgi:hypothetical protein
MQAFIHHRTLARHVARRATRRCAESERTEHEPAPRVIELRCSCPAYEPPSRARGSSPNKTGRLATVLLEPAHA